ncbi:hypothetical protein TTHERM_000357139 (macronuclear) [Tetrahymena thermophila SB210]|uniref:Uncharacterized protein n=1 Tax=Tetrahymena thermophila (strain SB210) TaxID=312017 RepID=W7X7E8_TETTS|nr:hypothetical protein TTHERM_000357139 [Tetrahymena thermophila SB210]EWS75295.1 hypothetical protein TTHERM_000357139 [Tetrahymena thermophila SB210]|eukprot:XP_012652286.1 hypothetical protein TTHERM_000357139 [Tetrahymena thermophila SB210]
MRLFPNIQILQTTLMEKQYEEHIKVVTIEVKKPSKAPREAKIVIQIGIVQLFVLNVVRKLLLPQNNIPKLISITGIKKIQLNRVNKKVSEATSLAREIELIFSSQKCLDSQLVRVYPNNCKNSTKMKSLYR